MEQTKDAARQLRRYYKRMVEGVCPRCGNKRDRPDRKLCDVCRAYFRMKTQERYAKRRAENRCYLCGDLKGLHDKGVFCLDCRDKNYYRTFIYK